MTSENPLGSEGAEDLDGEDEDDHETEACLRVEGSVALFPVLESWDRVSSGG